MLMKKILVVDNHPVMLKFMSNLLKKQGYEVRTAQDGLSALDILEEYTPDIMFVDLVMPNIVGEKLCRIIRSMPGTSDIYIIILSGIVAERKIDFAEVGANACIAKGPFNKMAQHVLFALDQSDLTPPGRVPDRVIGLEDVYERETSRELLSSKRHLERILDNMSEGIIELSPEARIVYANPAAVSLVGIAEEKLLSLSFVKLFHETYREGIKNLIKGSGDVQRAIGEDSPLILNGKRILLNILRVKDEAQDSVIIIMNDISERKRIEAQLRQAQKMESIATLAGGIAHQFNNALSVITGNVELLKMSPPEDDAAEYIEPIRNSAYRMAHLTSQLLAYARGGKYNPKTMSLSVFIEDTLPLLRHSINPAILMETNLPNLFYNIKADFTQMQMVLSAVVSNAGEAIEGKGCIRITSGIEDIVAHHPYLEPGCYVCLKVEDDGKGMDEETKNRMFEPFFTTNFQGRGLGMAAVYGIIQNHGGWISVDSELEKGTSVQIYLPAVGAVEKEVKQEEPQLEEGSGTILIVEDESMIMEVCRTMLEKLSYRVLEARTGEEAINIVRTFDGDIDLSILDIGLPDMDGDILYPILKEARADLKVIVCSGYAIDGPAQEILDAGAQGFIQKPYAFGVLSAKLKEVLGK